MGEDDGSVERETPLDRLPVDRHAAKQAAVLATVSVVVLSALGMGVSAAVTSGKQPVAAVDQAPIEPQAGTWEEAPSTTVQLHAQQMAVPSGGGSTDEVQVRALTNESHVAFRMEWDDPTNDANAASPENYSDAAAVMFGTGEMPPITMGGVGSPVNIWYWRASWQQDTAGYGTGGMYSYPNAQAGGPSQPGRAVGNPLSTVPEQGAQNIYAEGYGSTSDAPSQPVEATADRTDDGWAVTFVRERGVGSEYDAPFSGDTSVYVGFAVWNGSADARNGQKSITLQYRELDVESGSLSEAEQSGSSGSDGDASGDGSGDGGGGSTNGMYDWLGILLGWVVMVYAVSYWRISRKQ
jgi:DMSO reductase family type II enzyme heme b subunit